MSLDHDLRRLAERQHSVLATWQALHLGLTSSELKHRTNGPDWTRVTPGVMRLDGSPRTDEQLAMTAVLDSGPGSVLSHHSAAALWRLAGFELGDLHVTRLRDGTSRRGRLARLHYPTLLPPHHVAVFRGIPVTMPARLMFDLAGYVKLANMERTLDRAWSKGLFTGPSLYRVKHDLAGRGRRGNAAMRQLLVSRPADYRPPDSGLEGRVQKILQHAGFQDFERQINLGGEEWLGRVDFFSRRRKLILEVDSDLYHGALIDTVADERRTAALRAAGFLVVHVPEYDAWHRPWLVIDALERALRTR